ncbi:acyltransferase [Flavobacterium sp. 120]|uniref:acyltransferase family protein n=1 Tax=Flavobacterium sp. 120 TaxID=2135626 RepID=UPI000EAFA77D|nr:acyltransferase [Flavobacterium sp. 120]RKS13304.1 peptidoglycan/LPS O-acetylase OafA/YrhL [Flavobacterium sp. 120]
MNFIFSIKPGLFRLFLALLVVLYHLSKYIYLGGFAVYCFFILSGYWVVKMYTEKYSKLKQPILEFYASRIIRLYPLYLLTTLSAILMNLIFKSDYLDIIKAYSPINWITIFGLIGYNTGPWVIPPAWSLDIEMQFYILIPLLWILLLKIEKFGIILLVLLSGLIWLNFSFHLIDTGINIKPTVLPYLFYFALGIVLYLIPNIFSKKQVVSGMFMLVSIVIIHYVVPALRLKVIGKNDVDYFEQINLLLPLLIVPFISFNLKVKSNQRDRYYGNLSYAIYLCHWVLIIPYNYYIENLSFTNRIPYAFLYLVLTLLTSHCILLYFEAPIQDKVKFFFNKNHSTQQS